GDERVHLEHRSRAGRERPRGRRLGLAPARESRGDQKGGGGKTGGGASHARLVSGSFAARSCQARRRCETRSFSSPDISAKVRSEASGTKITSQPKPLV